MSDYVPGYSSKIPPSHRDELIRRRRSGEKCKTLAAEYGVHPATISRAVRAGLEERGEYEPVAFMEAQRRRRREGWQHVRSLWDVRDSTRVEANRQDAERLEREAQSAHAARGRELRERNLTRRHSLHGY